MRGSVIPSLKNSGYRPSTGKFKEALFSILNSGAYGEEGGVQNKEILDLFSGTCSLGFEAISRGAKDATFVDINLHGLELAKKFAQKMQIENRVTFIKYDATLLCPAKRQYDIAFIDPPYGEGMVEKSLKALHKYGWLKDNSWVIIEAGVREKIEFPSNYIELDKRLYGISQMLILRYKNPIV